MSIDLSQESVHQLGVGWQSLMPMLFPQALSPLFPQQAFTPFPEEQQSNGYAEEKSENFSESLRMPLCETFTCKKRKAHFLEASASFPEPGFCVSLWDVLAGNMEPQTVVKNRIRVTLIFGLSKGIGDSQGGDSKCLRDAISGKKCVFHGFFPFHNTSSCIQGPVQCPLAHRSLVSVFSLSWPISGIATVTYIEVQSKTQYEAF